MPASINMDKLMAYRAYISNREFEFGRYLRTFDPASDWLNVVAGMAVIHFLDNGNIAIDAQDFSRYPLAVAMGITATDFAQIKNDSIIGLPGETAPLIYTNGLLYTHKNWVFEKELAEWILNKTTTVQQLTNRELVVVNEVFGGARSNRLDLQKTAVKLALRNSFLVVSGGPGTGKTHTVKKIMEVYSRIKDETYNIALAAPTGKAAQRLSQAINDNSGHHQNIKAQTIHSLLQAKGTAGNFTKNARNKLKVDLLIVDEASMLDLQLWVALIRALPEKARLIVLGDRHQLASVEAGSILGDICGISQNNFSEKLLREINEPMIIESKAPARDFVITLSKSYRFSKDSGIELLANAIKDGEVNQALRILEDDAYPNVNLKEEYKQRDIFDTYVLGSFMNWVDAPEPIHHLNHYRILHALKVSKYGETAWNTAAEAYIKTQTGVAKTKEWYQGRPVLITQNHRQLGLRNGEVGVYSESLEGIVFENGETAIKPSLLPLHQPGFSLTIHKSQGSEYNHVVIVLPDVKNVLLNKELLYTAVTRARQSVLILSYKEIITYCIEHTTSRKSGLRQFFG